jgi:L-seryl-tRNA(Ser) seleniumtransferase
MNNLLRQIPKVDECLLAVLEDPGFENIPVGLIKKAVRQTLDGIRQLILNDKGREITPQFLFLPTVIESIKAEINRLHQPCFRQVINGTGVIIHTNLGRSVLPESTMQMLHHAGGRYSNLEFNLETGHRGSRYALVEDLLCELTGAEAALVVNNNAAAVLIVLETLARGREVIVSRGQLVEIGGSFRIPDVMARSGARLVEVGATNRTHLKDYQAAISEETGLLLKVHCSNYRIIGFTSEVSNEELVKLGRQHSLPVVEDLGSGCFVDLSPFGLEKEPTVQEVVSSGIDVVTFSGDKLLGGPQAGIIVGRKDLIAKCNSHPLMRSLRVGKLTYSALSIVSRDYLNDDTLMKNNRIFSMLSQKSDTVEFRANRLSDLINRDSNLSIVVESLAQVGGGTLPDFKIDSFSVKILAPSESVAKREAFSENLFDKLLSLDIPIVTVLKEGVVHIDCFTVEDDSLDIISKSIINVIDFS